MPPILTPTAPTTQIRTRVNSEFRAVEQNGQLVIRGYAALYNVETTIGWWYREVLRPGCFDSAIAGEDDVRCLWQHSQLYPLGRLAAKTLILKSDSKGLEYECQLGASQWARDAYDAIKRGDVSQSSFSFEPVEDRWTWSKSANETDLCERVKVRLWDVSPVTYPAYEDTEVSARSKEEWEAARKRRKLPAQDILDQLRSVEASVAADAIRG